MITLYQAIAGGGKRPTIKVVSCEYELRRYYEFDTAILTKAKASQTGVHWPNYFYDPSDFDYGPYKRTPKEAMIYLLQKLQKDTEIAARAAAWRKKALKAVENSLRKQHMQ